MRLGLVSRDGQVITRRMFLTPEEKKWELVLNEVTDRFVIMLDEFGTSFDSICGVGVGCPGTFDSRRECISFAPNLQWRNVPIKRYLNSKFPVPVWLENDTNLSTLGVSTFGEGSSSNILIGIFIGTGIGGGLILENKLFTGATGGAGEIGHMVVQENGPLCYCGSKGCIEAIASTRTLYDRVSAVISQHHEESGFHAFTKNDNKSSALKDIYMSGDPEAVQIIDDAFTVLGSGLVSLINVINPDMIVFGGGLAEALGDIIVERTSEVVRAQAMPGTFEEVSILCTKLGEDAPILGAAALVSTKLEN